MPKKAAPRPKETVQPPTLVADPYSSNGVYRLVGDWSRYDGPPRRLKRISVTDIFFDWLYTATNLDCLRFFPEVRSLNVDSKKLTDFTGIQHLRKLETLVINFIEPKYLSLDLAHFPALKSLDLQWSNKVENLSALGNLRKLNLNYIYSLKCLDLRSLTKLEELDIGPAKGVERLQLDGCRQITRLTLALMSRLTEITGTEFFKTVKHLDIRGTHLLPKKTLASFTALRDVMVGERSPLRSKDFPKCKPTVVGFPL